MGDVCPNQCAQLSAVTMISGCAFCSSEVIMYYVLCIMYYVLCIMYYVLCMIIAAHLFVDLI